MDTLIRQLDETIKQFKVRLCKNREEYNLSWEQVRDAIDKETGDKSGADRYRKWWYSYNEGFTDGFSEQLSGEEVLQEIEDRTIHLSKEKYKYQDQKREYNTVLRNMARFEHIKDELLKAVDYVSAAKPLHWSPVDVKINHATREAVILVSDLHKGAFASNFWNELNDDVFVERLQNLVNTTIRNCKEQGILTIHVFLLGDLVNGIIHVTTRIWNTENVIKQTKSVAELLSEAILQFANNFKKVYVYSVRGNHDRVTPNKHDSVDGESFADFIPWWMEERLARAGAANVQFMPNEYDDEIIVANVAGNLVFGVHGHKDRPNDVIKNLSMMLRKFPEAVVMGHYHHAVEDEEHGIELIINPTFSGVDEYAKNIRKTSKPRQKLLIFEQGEGRVCTYNIKL